MSELEGHQIQPAPESAMWQDGEPVNLAAAAADALEWLLLMERCVDRGVWRFGQPDSRNGLRCARLALQQMLNGQDAA